MGERINGIDEVTGSTPVVSIMMRKLDDHSFFYEPDQPIFPVLDVGFAVNTKFMEFFASKGHTVIAIDPNPHTTHELPNR